MKPNNNIAPLTEQPAFAGLGLDTIISGIGGKLIYKPMQYILESNGVFVKSVSKDEVTLTKKKEEAKVFPDALDITNHEWLLAFSFGLHKYRSQPIIK